MFFSLKEGEEAHWEASSTLSFLSILSVVLSGGGATVIPLR